MTDCYLRLLILLRMLCRLRRAFSLSPRELFSQEMVINLSLSVFALTFPLFIETNLKKRYQSLESKLKLAHHIYFSFHGSLLLALLANVLKILYQGLFQGICSSHEVSSKLEKPLLGSFSSE